MHITWRYSDFVTNIIVPTLRAKWDNVELAAKVKGGWEVWLQLEAYFMANQKQSWGHLDFEREVPYFGNTGEKADFRFSADRSDKSNFTVWSELKVDNASSSINTINTLTYWARDVAKIRRVQTSAGQQGSSSSFSFGGDDTVGATAVLWGSNWGTVSKVAESAKKALVDARVWVVQNKKGYQDDPRMVDEVSKGLQAVLFGKQSTTPSTTYNGENLKSDDKNYDLHNQIMVLYYKLY
jgi:hypothetical protein